MRLTYISAQTLPFLQPPPPMTVPFSTSNVPYSTPFVARGATGANWNVLWGNQVQSRIPLPSRQSRSPQ